jgi:potassium channel subfamily K protein 1
MINTYIKGQLSLDKKGMIKKRKINDVCYSFESALLFTVTIMTTVGYGHISPQTDDGKMFCIVYALIGE